MRKILFFLLLAIMTAPSSAANVLFIGDSHSVGPFGWKMDELIRRMPGVSVGSYASCGSVFNWWETGRATTCGYFFRDMKGSTSKGTKGATPIFDKLLKEVKPHVVVVELGANYAGWTSDEAAIKDMRNLVNRISSAKAKCFWISKPDARKGKENIPRILRLTRTAVEPYCTFFDSTLVTEYPAEGGDGVHYWNEKGRPIAEKWADEAFLVLRPLIEGIGSIGLKADKKGDTVDGSMKDSAERN
jgi:rubredoxin